MDRIDFKNGHHIDINTMNFMQDAYTKPIKALVGTALVDTYIVSGMIAELNLSTNKITVSDGYIALNGEFMEFRGGEFGEEYLTDSIYVVKREETFTNENSDGTSYTVMFRNYATLTPNFEPGAEPLFNIYQSQMIHYISLPNRIGDVNGTSRVSDDTTAKKYGYFDVNDSTPTYAVQDNTITLKGVFSVNKGALASSVPIGSIPNWEGVFISGIKCDLYLNSKIGDPTSKYQGFASISINGEISVMSKSEYFNIVAVVFDGTPYPIVKKNETFRFL